MPTNYTTRLLTSGFLLADEVDAAAAAALAARRPRDSADRHLWSPPSGCRNCIAVRPDVALDSADHRATVPIHAPLDARGRSCRTAARTVVGRRTDHGAGLAASLDLPYRGRRARRCLGGWNRGMVSPSCAEPSCAPVSGRVPSTAVVEWCDRRLLARIHRYTLNRLRADIAPVSVAEFQRFLFAWQHVDPQHALTGADGLRVVIAQLDGLELPARAWERDVLPARVIGYDAALLDLLCLTGEVSWARVSSGPTQLVGATPIALFLREHLDAWHSLHGTTPDDAARLIDAAAHACSITCRLSGASFFHELRAACDASEDELRQRLANWLPQAR